jgi:hypothetical protein
VDARFAVIVLVLIAAGCVRPKPETPASDPQTAANQPQVTRPADPTTEQPSPEPAAPATPQQAAEPAPSAEPEPVAKPAAPSPEEPVVAPAAPAPPQPAEKPAPAAPASPAPKPAAPSPSQPKPAQPAPGATKPAAPASGKADPPAVKPASTPTLDLNALKEEVKSTPAIGLFTKLTLKNQVDDLLDEFRDFHKGKSKRTKTDLRRTYDLLLMKVLSLLQDKDPKLASSIVSSREAIWDLLEDPKKFATVAS